MPLVPYVTVFFWKIIGNEAIWVPRMLIVLSMLGSIITIYFVAKKLFDNEYIAIIVFYVVYWDNGFI